MLVELDAGRSQAAANFLAADYDEAPVSIERFLDDDRYLGRVLHDPQGNSLLYDYWRNALKQIFSSNATEVVLTGPIGSGKSTIVDIAMAFILHMILCLRDPFDYYQLVRAQPITLLFFSLSKDLSNVGLFKGFSELLISSPWFRERGNLVGTKNQTIVFPHKHIDYSLGSPRMPGQGIVGRNVIAGGLDEISEITSAKEVDAGLQQDFLGTKALQIYEKVARRMESRFLQGGRQPGKLFLVSSKQDEAAFIERYIEKVKGSPHVLIFDDPIWEIKPRKMFSGVTFPVAIGDKYRDSRVMTADDKADELEAQGYDVIYVPIEYKRSFDLDVNGSLRDIAGISSSTTRRSKLIPRAEYLKRCVVPALHHPFTDQVVYLSDERGDLDGIEDYFKMDEAFLTAPYRYIHVDLGLNGDAAGISMCHIHHMRDVERMMEDGTVLTMRDHVVRFDFMLQIRNSTGASIPFWKIRRFIIYLRKLGVRIGRVSCDGWQSVDFLQLMDNTGFDVETLSIDKNDVPYVTFRNAVYEERVEWYEYSPMLKEASELEHLRRKKKVDHPFEGCFVGETRIPLLDGTCPMIEELDGREVWVYSSREDGVTVPGRARGRFTKTVTDLVDVVLDSGAVVRCTPEHLWMLRDGTYREARHLRPGFVASRGENHRVRYVIPIMLKEPVSVYDLEVDEWHNFALSAGVFVHNSKDVSDSGAGSLFLALREGGKQPAPEMTVEALRVMQKAKTGGIDPKWWMGDI